MNLALYIFLLVFLHVSMFVVYVTSPENPKPNSRHKLFTMAIIIAACCIIIVVAVCVNLEIQKHVRSTDEPIFIPDPQKYHINADPITKQQFIESFKLATIGNDRYLVQCSGLTSEISHIGVLQFTDGACRKQFPEPHFHFRYRSSDPNGKLDTTTETGVNLSATHNDDDSITIQVSLRGIIQWKELQGQQMPVIKQMEFTFTAVPQQTGFIF